jgi:cytoskeletal protein CcmA (bactofilin family)
MGNLHSPSVFIERGVEFQGTCRMDPIEDRTHKAAVAPVAAAAVAAPFAAMPKGRP